MTTEDRVKRLSKSVDDMYANLYLWHLLNRAQQDKIAFLYNKMGSQLGIVTTADMLKSNTTRSDRKGPED
jgi:hypothetical protein